MNAPQSNFTEELSTLIDDELSVPVTNASRAMSESLLDRYGDSVLGILYYGSCFRTGTEKDGILDIFVIVDSYQNVYSKSVLAIANKLLPPNVFYYEMEYEGDTLRTKYAVISLEQFIHRNSPRCFHTFYWARFAQPCALTYVNNEQTRKQIVDAIQVALKTFIDAVLPILPPYFDAETLWILGLSASYRTELRPESLGASARLVEKNLSRYSAVTQLSLAATGSAGTLYGSNDPPRYVAELSPLERWKGRQTWRVRRFQGKLINLLRIMKAAFTFDGGVDYVLWKIERHSGVKVEVTPMLRRHPLLTCWPTVWRLYRAGAFR
jgi:hypothetical protein